MADGQLGEDRMLPLDQEELDKIAAMHDQYPQSLAFRTATENLTLEQRVRELRLEDKLNECRGLIAKRQSLYIKGQKDAVVLASDVVVVEDASKLRADRQAQLQHYSLIPDPEPLILQADVLRDEVASLKEAYFKTSNIRGVVLAFYEKRKAELVQKNYNCLLRWARYCHTDEVMEQVRPLFEQTLDGIDSEFGSVTARIEELQTHARASAAVGTMSGVTAGDLARLLRHTTSERLLTKRARRFFTKLEWIPYTHRFDIYERSHEVLGRAAHAAIEVHLTKLSDAEEEHRHIVDSHAIPLLITNRAELDSALLELRGHWEMTTDIQADDGQEFFYYANKKFQNVFVDQVVSASLPGYDATIKTAQQYVDEKIVPEIASRHAERLKITTDTTHLKESRWLPFVTMKPEVDVDNVRQKARLGKIADPDKLLLKEAAFASEDNLEEAVKSLRRMQDSHRERAKGSSPLETDAVKAGLVRYAADDYVTQPRDPAPDEDEDHGSPSYLSPSKVLAFYFLRHVRIRDYKRKLLSVLNYIRSIERTLTIDTHGFGFEKKDAASKDEGASQEDDTKSRSHKSVAGTARRGAIPRNVRTAGSGRRAASRNTSRPAVDTPQRTTRSQHIPPERVRRNALVSDYPSDGGACMDMKGLECRDDSYFVAADGTVRVRDAFGVFITYDAAVTDLEALEHELLLLGTHYVSKASATRFQSMRRGQPKGAPADHVAVLTDLFESEFWFQETKRKLIDCYLEVYSMLHDRAARKDLAQIITNLMALRPRIDLTATYFAESYACDIVCLELQFKLVREVVNTMVEDARRHGQRVSSRALHTAEKLAGFPDPVVAEFPVALTPISSPVYMFEFHPCLAVVASLPKILKRVGQELAEVHRPETMIEKSALERTLLHQALVEWSMLLEEQRLHVQLASADEKMAFSLEPALIDDALSVEDISYAVAANLRDKASLLESEREGLSGSFEEASSGGKTPAKPTSSYADLSPLDTADPEAFTPARVLLRALEVLRLRHRLWGALYTTELLSASYKAQAKLLGVDLSKSKIAPIDLKEEEERHKSGEEEAEGAAEVVGAAIDAHLNLAIEEFDLSLAEIDVMTPEGIEALLKPNGDNNLRVAVRCQVTQKNIIATGLQFNQVVLDPALHAAAERNIRWNNELRERELMRALHGERAAPPIDEEGRRRKVAMLRKAKHTELANVSQYFFSVNQLKIKRRATLLDMYMDRYARLLQRSSEKTRDADIRALVEDLIHKYCTDVMGDLYPYAVRAQCALALSRLKAQLAQLPQSDVFMEMPDPDAPAPPSMQRPGVDADEKSGLSSQTRSSAPAEKVSMLSSDGKNVVNVWCLPHYKDILTAFTAEDAQTQARGMGTMLEIITAFNDIITFTSFIVRLGPTHDYLNPTTNLLEVPGVLSELQQECQLVQPDECVQFLWDKRRRLYLLFLFALRRSAKGFLDRENASAYEHFSWYFPSIIRPTKPLNRSVSPVELEGALAVASPPASVETCNRVSMKDMSILSCPFVGAHPPPSFATMHLLLVQLHDSDRRYVATEFEQVESLLEDLMQHNHVYQSSEPQKACAQQLGLLRTLVLTDEFMDRYMLHHMGPLPPGGSPVERNRAEQEIMRSVIIPSLVERLRKADYWHDEEERRVGSLGKGEYVPSMEHLTDVVPEKVLRDGQLQLLREMLDIKQLDHQLKETTLMENRLRGELEEMLHNREEPKSQGKQEEDQAAHDKLTFMQEFVHSLMSESQRGASSGKDEATLVIPVATLAELLDRLGHGLSKWAEERLQLAQQNAALLEQARTHALYISERDRKHLENIRAADKKAIKQKVQTEVADKGYELILELSDLYRQLAKVQETMETQAQDIRTTVRQDYEKQLTDAATRQTSLEANFTEYRKFLYEEMQNELHKIKQDTQKKFQEISRLPVDLKKRAQHIADLEGVNNGLREDNSKLEKTILKLKTMSKMKEIASAYSNAKMLRDEKKERFLKTRKLFEMRERMEQGEEMLKQLLAATQRALANAEQEIEVLRKDLELQQRNKKKLVKEKVRKTHLVEDLQERVGKYERWRNIDVDRLLLELDKKDAELRTLTSIKEQHTRKMQMNDRRSQREVRNLQKRLQTEQMMKNEAFDHLEELRDRGVSEDTDIRFTSRPSTRATSLASRGAMRSGSGGRETITPPAPAAPSAGADAAMWRGKFDGLLDDYKALMMESERLKQENAHLHSSVASQIQTARSDRSVRSRASDQSLRSNQARARDGRRR